MLGNPLDRIGAGSGGQLVELGQEELIFSLYLKLKSVIFPGISLAVGQLSSNGYLHIVEHVRKPL